MNRLTVILITLALLFVTTDRLHSQSVTTGAKGGLNFATFTDAANPYETRTGFQIGGFAKLNIPMTPFAIQPEILYSQKGATLNGNEIRMDYIEIPVMLKYTFLPGLIVKPNIFAGPYAGIRLVAESEGDTAGLLPGGGMNLDDQTESIDYGGLAGAGLDVEVGSSIFTIDARYGIGFRDVFTEESGKNGVFSVTVGISLPGI